MGKEVAGGFRMGNTCTPMADSCQCNTKTTAKSLQSCQTLCNPIDSSPPGSTIPGISPGKNGGGLPFPSPMHESEKRK